MESASSQFSPQTPVSLLLESLRLAPKMIRSTPNSFGKFEKNFGDVMHSFFFGKKAAQYFKFKIGDDIKRCWESDKDSNHCM